MKKIYSLPIICCVLILIIALVLITCPSYSDLTSIDSSSAIITNLKSYSGTSENITLNWMNSDNVDIEIIITPQEGIVNKTATMASITGLTDGKPYDFTVKTINPKGNNIEVSVTDIPCDATLTGGIIPSDLFGTWRYGTKEHLSSIEEYIIITAKKVSFQNMGASSINITFQIEKWIPSNNTHVGSKNIYPYGYETLMKVMESNFYSEYPIESNKIWKYYLNEDKQTFGVVNIAWNDNFYTKQ